MSIATRRDLLNLQHERNPDIIGSTKEIWLAADRTSGGTGTIDNPYSANTQAKVDAIWNANTGTGINFYYLPGVYQTNGYFAGVRDTIKPYQRHYGSGMYTTTVQLVNAYHETNDGSPFGMNYPNIADGFGVFDMTVDANNANQPKKASHLGRTGCIVGNGNNLLVERIRCIGYGSNQNPYECFPFNWGGGNIGQHARLWTNQWLRDSRFESPDYDNVDGLTCASIGGVRLENPSFGSGFHTYTNQGIESCYFEDHTPYGFLYTHGGSAQIVRNCVFDILEGVYFELTSTYNAGTFGSGWFEDVIIENNDFNLLTNSNGILLRHGSTDQSDLYNMLIRNNRFNWKEAGGYAITFDPGSGETGTVHNLIIKGNEFRALKGVSPTHPEARGIGIGNVINGVIMDNIFSIGAGKGMWTYNPTPAPSKNANLKIKRNYNIDGSLTECLNLGDTWTNTD